MVLRMAGHQPADRGDEDAPPHRPTSGVHLYRHRHFRPDHDLCDRAVCEQDCEQRLMPIFIMPVLPNRHLNRINFMYWNR